jgi:hypothetical protein
MRKIGARRGKKNEAMADTSGLSEARDKGLYRGDSEEVGREKIYIYFLNHYALLVSTIYPVSTSTGVKLPDTKTANM